MRRGAFALVVALGLAASTAQAAEPRALVDAAAAAMGGWRALDSVRLQEIVTTGADLEPLQALAPDAPARQVNTFKQTTLVDHARRRARITFDAKKLYPGEALVKFTEVLEPEVGVLHQLSPGKPLVERLHPSRRVCRLRDLDRLPVRVLYVARDAADLRRTPDRKAGGVTVQVLRYTVRGLAVELELDGRTHLPLRVVYFDEDPVESDSQNVVKYAQWRDVGDGTRQPYLITTEVNGKKLREEHVESLVDNPPTDEASFEIPADVRAQPENGEPIVTQWTLRRVVNASPYVDFGRKQRVELTPLAPGVFHVTGTSLNSMVVELEHGLLVVEMPLFEERSTAVLQALADRFPGKPVKYGVLTHFHGDHTGGVRAYAARGVTLLAPAGIVPWLKQMLARPRTVRPDALARAAAPLPPIIGVDRAYTVRDGDRTVELHAIPNTHAADMIVAYVPKEKILFVSDLFRPGTPLKPGELTDMASELLAALTKAGVVVERIAGGHGGVSGFDELTRQLAAPARPAP